MSEFEAKRIYVDGLIKVRSSTDRNGADAAQILKGFSDRSIAVSHVRELENFTLDPPRRNLGACPLLPPDAPYQRPAGSQRNSATREPSEEDETDSDSDDSERYLPPLSASSSRRPPPPSTTNPRSSSQSYPSSSSQQPPSLRARRPARPAEQITPKRRTAAPQGTMAGDGAPSLPGYGPPRTAADLVRERNYGSSRSRSERSSSSASSCEDEDGHALDQERRGTYRSTTPVPRSLGTNSRSVPLKNSAQLSVGTNSVSGSKPPIDAALDRIQASLTTLHARLASLEQKKETSPPGVENGKYLAIATTSNPFKNFINLLFLHSSLVSSSVTTLSTGSKIRAMLKALMRISLVGLGRVTLDLLVGVLLLGGLRRVFGNGTEKKPLFEVVKKVLL